MSGWTRVGLSLWAVTIGFCAFFGVAALEGDGLPDGLVVALLFSCRSASDSSRSVTSTASGSTFQAGRRAEHERMHRAVEDESDAPSPDL